MYIAVIAGIDANMKNEMPKYFLKDIATIIAGQSPESKYYNISGEGLPFFQGKADFGRLYPKIKNYCSQPTKIAEKDDILLSVRAPVGPTNLSPGKVCIGRGLTAIRPNSNICLKYLLYFFRYYEAQLQKSGTGTTFKAITQNVIKNIEVPVPPPTKQEQIVSKIEELFSRLDASVTELQTAKEKLKIYRQSILKEAFNEHFALHKLKDLCFFITKGTTPPKKELSSIGEIPFIKVYNLTFNTVLDFSIGPTYISKAVHTGQLARSIVLPGDVLMNIVGPPMGKVSIVPNTFPEWNINQAIVRFRCNSSLNNKYLAYYLCYSQTVDKMKQKSKATAGQFNLTLEICRNVDIPLPSIEKQLQIVSMIESQLSVCNSIEQIIDTSLQQAEALRQSILKQAFEGELV